MRSFVVEACTPFETERYVWDDVHSLECRSCEAAFVSGGDVKVGQVLTCPFCAAESVVPKKARWG